LLPNREIGDNFMFFSSSVMRIASRKGFLAGVALLALSVPASAQNIDTHPQWNGTQFIFPWGITDTATYGQTFIPTAQQTRLAGFTVELWQTSGTPVPYTAHVYAWDSVNNRITGPSLFASGPFVAPAGAVFTPVSINTGSVALTPGQQYVLFLTTSGQQAGQPTGNYRWGSVTNTAIPTGRFVFQNNTNNFGNLSTVSWSFINQDLAITINLFGFLSQLLPPGTPINPTNVAAAIDKYIAAGGTLPAGLGGLFGLNGQAQVEALGQLSGENATQAQSGAFQLGNSYLSLLTDPFSANKVGSTGPLGYAAPKKMPPAVAAANAMVTKAPPMVYVPRWDVWGAAFGGTNDTHGEITTVGSHDAYTRVGAVAAGADYRYAPDSLIGFSLAGGNINWSLTGGAVGGCCGGGKSDAFMAGIYGRHNFGMGYLSGAATFGNYWMETDRNVFVAGVDRLHADFGAQSWGARLEGGYFAGRYWNINWTPYAAIQGQGFRTPNYTEVATIGPNPNQFALTFASRTATAVRGEIGLRNEKVMAVNDGQLSLFGKFAYAHDEISNPAANATFAALGPVAGFTVYGARPSRDLALTTAGAEWRLASGVSFMVKFDGEFGDRSETYSGTGRIRYTW
jgi:uncharacterized protein with beta-barrel porin domain